MTSFLFRLLRHAIPPWPVTPPSGGLGGGGYTGDMVRTEAEYIWSAASTQPFDTCHVQIDWWDREAWFIQDHATGTVRAYTDANGEMARQYRFDAFGNLTNLGTFPLASGTNLFANFRNRLGHHGLFAERVDGDTTQLTLSPNPGAELWYQSRSRWYVPELGRFMTSDPNETGIPTMNSLAMLGRVPTGPPSGSFGWEGHYGDGWDTWTSYGGNPVTGSDPTGLSVDPFESAFEIIGLHQATSAFSISKALHRAGTGLKSIQAYTAMASAWDDLVMDRDAGILMGMAIGPFFSTTCFEESTLVHTAKGLAPIGDVRLGTRVVSERDPAARLLNRSNGFVIDESWYEITLASIEPGRTGRYILLRPHEWIVQYGISESTHTSFALSDRHGLEGVCVESIRPFDGPVTVSRGDVVTGVFRREATALLRISLSDEEHLLVTPEHRLWSDSRNGWLPADQLRVGDLLRNQDGGCRVVGIEPECSEIPVANLEVGGNHTYFVGTQGIWAHNGCTLPKGLSFGSRRGGQSARSAQYQSRITGLADDVAVYSKGVEFDGFVFNQLIDAKGPGYEGIMASRHISESVAKKMADQAERQLGAAGRYIKYSGYSRRRRPQRWRGFSLNRGESTLWSGICHETGWRAKF